MGLPLELSGDLTQASLLSLVGGGFLAALLHAALPTHWLPFVAVGRAQGWSRAVTLAVAALAGTAHIFSTAVVGSILTVAGDAIPWLTHVLPYAAAAVLTGFAFWYLARAMAAPPPLTALSAEVVERPRVGDGAAIWGLVAFLAASPGEALLPVYVGAGVHGWGVVLLLTLAFAAGTILGMVLFTAIAQHGVERFRLQRWARFEGVALGVVLLALAIFVLLQHGH